MVQSKLPTRDEWTQSTLEIAIAEQPVRWVLEIQDQGEPRRVLLGQGRTILGTGSSAHIPLHDPAISAEHCAVTVAGQRLFVEDNGSKNGTFVGNARIRQAFAEVGTTLVLGRSTIVCGGVDGEEELDGLGEPLQGIAGASVAMRRIADKVRRLAQHSFPVLISGESGTGKELIARALHDEGPRQRRPFVAINVAALPRELVESEMFGHERGAFTGAVERRGGAFFDAELGTLFLDEIGELPLDAQPKLLRALDGYEVRRVGASGMGRRANVRVVAATHVPLEERVHTGGFRRDLFHRLEVFVVELPPLRERRGDIAPIARALLAQASVDVGPRELTSGALARLVAHPWPGNVRELRNVLIRAADRCSSRRLIQSVDIEASLRDPLRVSSGPVEVTYQVAQDLLAQHGNNLSAAARAAGCPRTSFRKVLRRGGAPSGSTVPSAARAQGAPRKGTSPSLRSLRRSESGS